MDRKHVLVVAPYGYITHPSDDSSGAKGSIARLLYAAMLIHWRRIPRKDLLIVFPQKAKRVVDRLPDLPTLGEQMAAFLRKRAGWIQGVHIKCEPRSWGTLEDTLATYEMVKAEGWKTNVHLHFVTDPVHLRRLRLIWNYTHPQGWTATFHAATFHQRSRWERFVYEPLAWLKCLFKLRQMRAASRGKK